MVSKLIWPLGNLTPTDPKVHVEVCESISISMQNKKRQLVMKSAMNSTMKIDGKFANWGVY